MTNQPNTEDGNEWIDNILDKYFNDGGGWNGNGKEAILNYIQSNYILKSDVERIIGEDEKILVRPEPMQGIDNLWLQGRAEGDFTGRNELRAEQRKKLNKLML